jgi:GGDEF domain-containing protein
MAERSESPELTEEPPTRPAPSIDRSPTGHPAPTAHRATGDAATATYQPFLTVLSGAEAGQARFLGPEGVVIGRSRSAGLMFPEDTVSRQHARISFDGARYVLKDLGSNNGTYLNGSRISEQALSDGDRVALGSNVVLRFNLAAIEASGSPSTEEPRDASGAADRPALERRLSAARLGADRQARPLSLLFVRVDAHPQLLAALGEAAAGQKVLEVSRLLVSQVRRGDDLVARFDPSTLCALLSDISVAQARALAERILYRLDQLKPFGGAHGSLVTFAPVDATPKAHPRMDDVFREGEAALTAGSARASNCVLKARK